MFHIHYRKIWHPIPGNIIKVCQFVLINVRVQKYRKEEMNLITSGMNTLLNLIYYNTWIYNTHTDIIITLLHDIYNSLSASPIKNYFLHQSISYMTTPKLHQYIVEFIFSLIASISLFKSLFSSLSSYFYSLMYGL